MRLMTVILNCLLLLSCGKTTPAEDLPHAREAEPAHTTTRNQEKEVPVAIEEIGLEAETVPTGVVMALAVLLDKTSNQAALKKAIAALDTYELPTLGHTETMVDKTSRTWIKRTRRYTKLGATVCYAGGQIRTVSWQGRHCEHVTQPQAD